MAAYDMFNEMLESIQQDTVRLLFHVRVEQKEAEKRARKRAKEVQHREVTNSGLRWESQLTTIVNALPLTTNISIYQSKLRVSSSGCPHKGALPPRMR